MTVQELINALSGLDPSMEVRTAANAHDYWGSELALEIKRIDLGATKWSDYHNNWRIVEDHPTDDGEREMVLLYDY